MADIKVLEVKESEQLESLARLISSGSHRVVSLNHDNRIVEDITPVGIQDVLHVSNVQRIVPPETFLHQAIIMSVIAATSRNQVVDGRRGNRFDTIEELAERFVRAASPRDISLAQNRKEHLAYIEREMITERFLVHDVAEQLMLYKRDNKAGYLIVDDFLRYCRNNNVLGDVVLAMMVHKLYKKKEDKREQKYRELNINPRIVAEIENVFGHGKKGNMRLEEKQVFFSQLAKSADVCHGSLDGTFLEVISVDIRKAIIFTFKSLFGHVYEEIQQRSDIERTRETITAQAMEETVDITDCPQELMIITNPVLSNLVIPFPRSWIQEIPNLSPATILGGIMQYYSNK